MTNDAPYIKRFCGSVCDEHKEYRGFRKPQTGCEECWRWWIMARDDERARAAGAVTTPPGHGAMLARIRHAR